MQDTPRHWRKPPAHRCNHRRGSNGNTAQVKKQKKISRVSSGDRTRITTSRRHQGQPAPHPHRCPRRGCNSKRPAVLRGVVRTGRKKGMVSITMPERLCRQQTRLQMPKGHPRPASKKRTLAILPKAASLPATGAKTTRAFQSQKTTTEIPMMYVPCIQLAPTLKVSLPFR